MNRQKSAPRIRPSTYAAMIATGMIIAGGGMLHADYKYRQIKVSREIKAVERQIEQCQLASDLTQMHTANLLNCFAIQKQLIASRSSLRPIAACVAEEVISSPPTAVAAANP